MIFEKTSNIFLNIGIPPSLSPLVTAASLTAAAAVLTLMFYLAGVLIINKVLKKIISRSKTRWDNVLFEKKVFHHLMKILSWFLLFFIIPAAYAGYPDFAAALMRILRSIIAAQIIFTLISLLNAGNTIYDQSPVSKQRPLKGYFQLVTIFLYIIAGILVVTAVLNVNPAAILSGFGAMSAVLLLVFKDSIMGLVSSFQLSANDMVRLGDWIEMPGYGANGDVIDISLQTVKIRNFDMTITTIPIYALISDSFINWRGMSDSGGRRIMRQINIDAESVGFCTPEMLALFKAMAPIKTYIQNKETEISAWNREHAADPDDAVSSRRLTNIGTFRAYMAAYLKRHPGINQEMICMVRQLASGPQGIPLEVYAFIRDKAWVNYESIQADIFDHFFAVLPKFGLRMYQQPSGWDVRNIGIKMPFDGSEKD